MNNQFKPLLIALSSLTLLACNDDTQIEPTAETQTQAITLNTQPISVNLDSQTIDPIITSQDYVSFITPLAGHYQAPKIQTQQQQNSDQYWLTVTGKALNQGIQLPISQTNASVRISPKQNKQQSLTTTSIDSRQISFMPVNAPASNKTSQYMENILNADKLATAGVFAHSSGFTLRHSAPIGLYQMQVKQTLAENAQYIINVKEKNSPKQLSLTAPLATSQTDNLTLSLTLANQALRHSPTAMLFDNHGNSYPLSVTKQAQQWQLTLANGAELPTSQHLMALEINTNEIVAGQLIKRSIRTAIKRYSHSANIDQQLQVDWQQQLPQQLSFNLNVASASRFDVSAVITGTDQQGQEISIMRTQAAQWFETGKQTLTLPIDQALISQMQLSAPFRIRELTLTDQGQLARLSYQAYASELHLH